MAKKSFLARLIVIRRDHQRAIDSEFFRRFVSATACCVLLEPVPARTWQRLLHNRDREPDDLLAFFM